MPSPAATAATPPPEAAVVLASRILRTATHADRTRARQRVLAVREARDVCATRRLELRRGDAVAALLEPGDSTDACARVTLPQLARSAAVARTLLVRLVLLWDSSADVDAGQLLLSEMVGNAVLHARTAQVGVAVTRTGEVVRVHVLDDDPTLPRDPREQGPAAESGRGMSLVAMLAPRWGVRRTPTGKTVWFDLPPTAGTAPSP